MRREPEFFGEGEPCLVYIAKKLKEALTVEELFTAYSLDYLVEPDKYRGGLIFATERVGAFFYVAQASVEIARAALIKNKYRPYDTDPANDSSSGNPNTMAPSDSR